MASESVSLLQARARIAAAVEASLDKLVAAAAEAIWTQVPAYHDSVDERLRDDVAVHVAAVFRVFLASLTDDRPARRADFANTRDQATRRVGQGISLADFLKAFRIGQLTLWQGVLDAARGDQEAREAALLLVAQLMDVIELGSTVAAEAYVEAQQHRLAERDRVRRDLIEDLLAGRTTFTGQKRSILAAAGLGPDTRLLVTAAAPAGDAPDDQTLAQAASAMSGTRDTAGSRLSMLRQEEIVGVLPVPRGGAEAAVSSVRRAYGQLRQQDVRLAIGVSTVHTGLHEVPDAYAEALVARDGLGASDGVLALPTLTAFEYLMLRESQTAQRLIRPEVKRFVVDDAATGGALIVTLLEYAASDLNAKIAAKRLHKHVNTAYYRLERIAERTGCDLRRLADVVELVIAIRLLGADRLGSRRPMPDRAASDQAAAAPAAATAGRAPDGGPSDGPSVRTMTGSPRPL
jgi:sugar diacid utilization regulator